MFRSEESEAMARQRAPRVEAGGPGADSTAQQITGVPHGQWVVEQGGLRGGMTAAARRQSAGHLWRQIERLREEHGKSTEQLRSERMFRSGVGGEAQAKGRRRRTGS